MPEKNDAVRCILFIFHGCEVPVRFPEFYRLADLDEIFAPQTVIAKGDVGPPPWPLPRDR